MPDGMHCGALVSDFDGTVTRFDFYDLLCRRFPGIVGEYWDAYEAGRLSHFEALRSIFAGIRAPEAVMVEMMGRMEIEPALKDRVARLNDSGWTVTVASAGCEWYIRRLLAQQDVALTVHSNPGEYFPDQGLLMRLPEGSPFLSREHGVDKAAVVRHAQEQYNDVAFAGDGRTDVAAALLVSPKRRFARAWLAERLRTLNEEFIPFERWADVAGHLLADGVDGRAKGRTGALV